MNVEPPKSAATDDTALKPQASEAGSESPAAAKPYARVGEDGVRYVGPHTR